jgi:molecular chaperone DnaJ
MANFSEIEEARKLLGLGEAATLKEIKRAYRTLAHRYHPDKHSNAPDEQTGEAMKRLNWAYKLLVDYCTHDEYLRRYTMAGLRVFNNYFNNYTLKEG